MKKQLFLGALTVTGIVCVCGCGKSTSDNKGEEKGKPETEPITVEKSEYHNPITGFGKDGTLRYGGDPAAMVDGDVVYLYTGHDTASNESYVIPEWQCYSSRDMKEWTYEGVILSCKDIIWADNNSAWAAQTVKHYSTAEGKDKYYFYFCSWDSTSEGKQSIGVAVSDSPTGPFQDIGHPLVKGTVTTNESSGWNDIDPTAWVETDENGEEHRYLGWGNGKYYICELNEDMISVKDLDGDGAITFGKDILEKTPPESYTEAPWFYRRQDENGNYYGDYYLFYAYGWREQMAYATTDDLINGEWKFGGIIMEPSATSNTNHMSVIDFQGKTYFIYHNGSLEKGSGFRRVACVEEISIQENGEISYIPETAAGPFGTATVIKSKSGQIISHKAFHNSSDDGAYPYLSLDVGPELSKEEADGLWVLVPGKTDTKNENYVSIVSYNKPGLYITGLNKFVKLSQNAHGNLIDAQTFKTVKGLSGDGVSFESVAEPGMYITTTDTSVMKMTDGSDKDACTFYLTNK